jgi:hypothetical protein
MPEDRKGQILSKKKKEDAAEKTQKKRPSFRI